ncbi:MaoC/PaaZ C-terminal domain-containing protein [Sphaerisporangium sp. NPDC088356]|uniref:MaoC/PaaZ C-terminal domain-containing protein n=1 Tax=Sphaerisporangium sp. NPDC088356 TaxID=3154871 RepID=UPI0034120B1F
MTGQEVLYFEDLYLGMAARSPGRTVTEADIVAFAGLSGDFNPLHTDAEVASASAFGRRVGHGLLGTAIASGLFTRTPLSQALQGSLVAMLGIEWRFERPILIGDTIHVEAEVVELRETSRPDRGLVVIERRVIDQSGTRVQSGKTPMLVTRRTPVEPSKGQS